MNLALDLIMHFLCAPRHSDAEIGHQIDIEPYLTRRRLAGRPPAIHESTRRDRFIAGFKPCTNAIIPPSFVCARLVTGLTIVDREVDRSRIVVDGIIVRHYQMIPTQPFVLRHIVTAVHRTAFRLVVKFRR
jgi:hypothetical protein